MSNHKQDPLKANLKDAIERFSKLTQEELKNQIPEGEPVPEGQMQLVLFKGKEIRQTFHDSEWFFSIIDVISVLAETSNPRRYWSDLKKKLVESEGFSELYDSIVQLKLQGTDGKYYETDAANTETLFRIIQSIPSKTAEPFKKWLAKVGYERIQEIQNPEIAIKRAMMTYKIKGYSSEWINARVQTIVSRKELTHEWAKRCVKEGMEYALLTDAISIGTFGLRTKHHKDYKRLKDHHSLRDHMTPLELALTMLGEITTTEIARHTDANGFQENESAAKSGGEVAGRARKDVEKKIGRPVVSRENFLPGHNQKKLK